MEERHAEGQTYETLAICRTPGLARSVFADAVEEKPAFMIRIPSFSMNVLILKKIIQQPRIVCFTDVR
jgi:hypothetical protein